MTRNKYMMENEKSFNSFFLAKIGNMKGSKKLLVFKNFILSRFFSFFLKNFYFFNLNFFYNRDKDKLN
jgi:hypothetical protein